ncbi:MAG: glycoside hydrolase family 1 protein [Patescibacteria group bacterium]
MDQETKKIKFPENFFWGCSTSAHQVEGGLNNDWSEWENSPKRLAELKNKQLDPIDFISGQAANSFLENNADIACLKELNNNTYRFSIDWSRIEPEEGQFNLEALEYYKDFIFKLKANGLEPFVTLWHWPLPLWLSHRGGWTKKETANSFEKFTNKVLEYLGDDVNFWITLNEPMVYVGQSYLIGEWPPQKRNIIQYLQVIFNLIRAHKLSFNAIKKYKIDAQVGIAQHCIYFEPAGNKFINRILAKIGNWWSNDFFLNKIVKYQDFIGLNYYFHSLVNYNFNGQYSYEKKSDIDWGLHPEGIYHCLKNLAKYKKIIYITENGLADKGDQYRSWYIKEILENVNRAMTENIEVGGYFHWSLIDNFEWAFGFAPCFGLYEVNHQTFERIARPSAQFYADICKNNGIE